MTDNDPPGITGDSGDVGVGTGDTVTLWVTASDNIGVVGADVFVDGGAAQAMIWDSGDSRWEYDYVASSGDDSDHNYTLTVYDAEGLSDVSGPYDIVVTDNDPPLISNVAATPASQIVDGYVNITATISDNIDIDSVKVYITGPAGFMPVNTSMAKSGSGDIYYYNNNYSIVGLYNYSIWANDTTGNSFVSAIYQFEIVAELEITNMLYKWNFLSLPFNESVNKTNLFIIYNGSEYNWTEATTGGDPIILGFIYGWNRSSQSYAETDDLEPGYGYWMYAYHDCELWARGVSAITTGNYITSMVHKWNTVGVPADQVVNKTSLKVIYSGTEYNWTEATTGPDPILLPFIYSWNRTSQSYLETNVLEPGYCYWMYAYYDCILRWEVS